MGCEQGGTNRALFCSGHEILGPSEDMKIDPGWSISLQSRWGMLQCNYGYTRGTTSPRRQMCQVNANTSRDTNLIKLTSTVSCHYSTRLYIIASWIYLTPSPKHRSPILIFTPRASQSSVSSTTAQSSPRTAPRRWDATPTYQPAAPVTP